jgi:hypothetical protein
LLPGNTVDAVEGRLLVARVGQLEGSPKLLMDRAYEDDRTRHTAVVPPKRNRRRPWPYER